MKIDSMRIIGRLSPPKSAQVRLSPHKSAQVRLSPGKSAQVRTSPLKSGQVRPNDGRFPSRYPAQKGEILGLRPLREDILFGGSHL